MQSSIMLLVINLTTLSIIQKEKNMYQNVADKEEKSNMKA